MPLPFVCHYVTRSSVNSTQFVTVTSRWAQHSSSTVRYVVRSGGRWANYVCWLKNQCIFAYVDFGALNLPYSICLRLRDLWHISNFPQFTLVFVKFVRLPTLFGFRLFGLKLDLLWLNLEFISLHFGVSQETACIQKCKIMPFKYAHL